MAATTTNPCCAALRAKYLKSEKNRDALRQGVKILKDQYGKLQAEHESLKKDFDEEKSARACLEKDLKENESPSCNFCEDKACDPTSPRYPSKQETCVKCQNKDDELTTLHLKIREREAEIDMLKMLLAEEKRSADTERENAKMDRQRALVMKEALEAEKTRADRSCIVPDPEVTPKHKSDMDDSMVLKYKKLAEENEKKVIQEQSYANNLLTQLQEEMVKIERLTSECKELRSSHDSVQSGFVAQLSAKDSEVEQLKHLLIEQKMRVDSEEKKASSLLTTLESERGKVVNLTERVDNEVNKCQKYLAQMDLLRKEVHEGKLQLDAEKLKCKDLCANLERQKQKFIVEKRLADAEKANVASLKKLAEENEKKIAEEKSNSICLISKIKEERQKVEKLEKKLQECLLSGSTSEQAEAYKKLESKKKKLDREKKRLKADAINAEVQKKLTEEYRKKAVEEKCRADNLTQELEKSKQLIQVLEQELSRTKSCKVLAGPSVSSGAGADMPDSKVKLLREQLKLERKQVKLAKNIANFEKDKNTILHQELARLKHAVASISQHLDMLNSAFNSSRALNGSEKTGGLMNLQGQYLPCPGPTMSGSSARNLSDCVNTTLAISKQENCMKLTPGIETKLHPLVGSSQQEISPSYAMNFSEASSSDKQLLGSQEPVAGSLCTSTVVADENPKSQQTASRWLSATGKRKSAEYLASAVEISDCPLVDIPSPGKKRKIFYEPDCIQFESQMLPCLMERTLTEFDKRISRLMEAKWQMMPGQKGNPICDGSDDTRKVFREPVTVTENSHDVSEQMEGGKISTLSPCARLGGQQAYKDDIAGPMTNGDIFVFEQLVSRGGYMKLLELDNVADEELYRMAIERPLSPTLPEVNGDNCRAGEDSSICHGEGDLKSPSTCKIPKRRSIQNMPFCSSLGRNESIIVNERSKQSHSSGSGSAQGVKDAVKLSDAPKASTELSNSTELQGGVQGASPFCILLSHVKDVSSIIRMFCATRTCSIHYCLHSQEDWVVTELLTHIVSEEELIPREKFCVIFSLILQNYLQIISNKSENNLDQELLRSLLKHLCSEKGQMFAKLFDLDDLLSLYKDFVSHRRILVPCDMGFNAIPREEFKFDFILDGVRTGLCYKTALSNQLVAASVIFSSICLAIGQMNMVWEASFSIIPLWGDEPELVLCILHVFAHVVEVKYLSSRNYTSLIAILKSLLRHFGGLFKVGYTDAHLLVSSALHFSKCNECSFLENPRPFDVALLLVGELKRCASEKMFLNASNMDAALISCYNQISSSMPLDAADLPESEDLCYTTDVMSLTELISTVMGWEWTASKILPVLLKILESCTLGNFSTSLVFLIGRLGRYGVEKVGYKDSGAESICQCLSSFLDRISLSGDNPIHAQIAATVAALNWISVYRRSETDEFVQTSGSTFSSAANSIRDHLFASLTSEQRLLVSGGFPLSVSSPEDQVRYTPF